MSQHDRDIVALVLAAGRGKRFGVDKRSIALEGGKTLLEATVDSVIPHFSRLYIVIRDADDPGRLRLRLPMTVVRSVRADGGMGYSIADGVAALEDSKAAAVAVLLGDMPCIEPETFRTLITQAGEDRIVRPEFQGRAGHPVIFGRAFWRELINLQGKEGARSVIHRHLDACIHIEVDDPGVRMDADRPEDLDVLRARYRRLAGRRIVGA